MNLAVLHVSFLAIVVVVWIYCLFSGFNTMSFADRP